MEKHQPDLIDTRSWHIDKKSSGVVLDHQKKQYIESSSMDSSKNYDDIILYVDRREEDAKGENDSRSKRKRRAISVTALLLIGVFCLVVGGTVGYLWAGRGVDKKVTTQSGTEVNIKDSVEATTVLAAEDTSETNSAENAETRSETMVDATAENTTQKNKKMIEGLNAYQAPTELTDDPTVPEAQIEEKVYRFPCPIEEFLDDGWEIEANNVHSEEDGEKTRFRHDQVSEVYSQKSGDISLVKNDSSHLSLHVYNPYETAVSYDMLAATGFNTSTQPEENLELDIVFPGERNLNFDESDLRQWFGDDQVTVVKEGDATVIFWETDYNDNNLGSYIRYEIFDENYPGNSIDLCWYHYNVTGHDGE